MMSIENNKKKKQIAILGSTGSIGTQALQVIEEHPDLYEPYALTANNRVERSIKGPKAELTIYVTVKRQRQTQVQPLVDRLKAAWAKLPTTPTTGGTNVLK